MGEEERKKTSREEGSKIELKFRERRTSRFGSSLNRNIDFGNRLLEFSGINDPPSPRKDERKERS